MDKYMTIDEGYLGLYIAIYQQAYIDYKKGWWDAYYFLKSSQIGKKILEMDEKYEKER